MASDSVSSRPLVLNVDAREEIRSARSRVLESAGFRVREAASGADALRLAAELAPDLVLLPLTLPDAGGPDVSREIRSNAPDRAVPVLRIGAAHADQHVLDPSLNSGADVCLAEPVQPFVLVATARALLGPEPLERRLREMARLRVHAESAAEHLEKLQAITAALSEAATLDQVLDVIVKRGRAVTSAAGACVALLREGENSLDLVRTAGCEGRAVKAGLRFPVGAAFPIAEAVRAGRPVFVGDARERANRYPELPSAGVDGALVAVPMTVRGRTVGGLGFRFGGGRRWSAHDRDFYLNLAAPCAAAIERARLHDSERRLFERERLERKRLEKFAGEARLQARLVELSSDAIIVCDRDRRVTGWNPAAAALYGWSASEAIAKNVDDLLSTRPRFLDQLLRHERWEGELTRMRRDGSLVTVRSRQAVVRDEAGGLTAFLAIERSVADEALAAPAPAA